MLTNLSQNITKFECCLCDIKTNNKKDFIKHKLTLKHLKREKLTLIEHKIPINPHLPDYVCNLCNKVYKSRVGLWSHKKKCNHNNEPQPDNLVIELIKQNDEFKNMLVEQNNKMLETFQEVCKNNNTNITNNNVNSHNKAFNLNVFLNEDCKDAMNVTQFIDSFNLQLSDFENVGNVGFVNGISDIIIKKLKSLDENERPIHCTDQKRQVLYAKVIDKWEKEGDDNKILRRIIKCVAFKNSKNIQLFRDKYPDCMNWDSKHADRYQILRIESLGGLGNEDVDNENKIIRKIAREILIDKSL
jgi:Zinc-finger of C2H2 type